MTAGFAGKLHQRSFVPLRYIWSHINTIIESYSGGLPLTHFLKNYFRLHPKLGSRDRKILSEMAYCWYRAGKGLPETLSFEDKVKACLLICETSVPQVKQFIPAEWQEHSPVSFDLGKIAPFNAPLSEGITTEAWSQSMLEQPRLFIRLRRNKKQSLAALQQAGIAFHQVGDHCLSLPNGAAVDKVLPAEDYVVQDASSQETSNYFNPRNSEHWWDCCSGAGGKSLLLKDIDSSVILTVSDVRASILSNLSERFRQYGHKQPQKVIIDVSDDVALESEMRGRQFDSIICDVPCTGAGTWARTPEQLHYFKEEYITEFAERQRKIALNVSRYLKPGGALLYITCSVFKAENEQVVEYVLTHTSLKPEHMQLINGLDKKADCMFIAVLRK